MVNDKFKLNITGTEGLILDEFISSGLFNSKHEVIRSALIKYAIDLNLFNRRKIWHEIQKAKTRSVSAKQLLKDLENIENET